MSEYTRMNVIPIKDKIEALEDHLNHASELASELYDDFEALFQVPSGDNYIPEEAEEMAEELLNTLHNLQNLTDIISDIRAPINNRYLKG